MKSQTYDDLTIKTEVKIGEESAYDPMRDLFIAQTKKPAHLREVNLRVLSPFHRSLLVFDGTVTKLIEAYTMEPVKIIRLSQGERRLSNENIWLEAPKGTQVIARQVILRGAYSYSTHVYAVSLIVHDRLPDNIRRSLRADGDGIGGMLIDSRMETFREILWYGMERLSSVPEEMDRLANEEFLSRTYRVISNKKPIILINERFPMGSDLLPSHH